MWSTLCEDLLCLLFPYDAHCPLCQRWLVGFERGLCNHCERRLQRCSLTPLERVAHHPPLQQCISCFAYESPANELIWQLKYHSDTTIAPLLGLHMCAVLWQTLPRRRWDAVIPVPMHPDKARRRGYNQAQLLAREVAAQRSITLRTDCLFRRSPSISQTRRNATQRQAAMEGVFVASRNVAGQSILLVDDVLTTGATACACAKALLAAGAADVTLITVCQA